MGDRLQSVEDVVNEYCVSNNRFKSLIYQLLGVMFTIFAMIGIFVPGWPTVSWAVPAAFMFSLSNERLFRWTLTNKFFGTQIFDYYSTGKSLPKHVKYIIMAMVGIMTSISAYLVWYVSTKGDGNLSDIDSWNGADQYAMGSLTIIFVGFLGMIYVRYFVNTRSI